MAHSTTRRPKESILSQRSPAGRTFAFEFSRIRGIAPVLENEIAKRVDKNANSDFCLMRPSGMSMAPRPLHMRWSVNPRGETPEGVLSYELTLPAGSRMTLTKEVRIYLGQGGCPIFQIGQCKFNDLDSAAILMAAAIGHMLA